jgi:hypothetical protein
VERDEIRSLFDEALSHYDSKMTAKRPDMRRTCSAKSSVVDYRVETQNSYCGAETAIDQPKVGIDTVLK